MSKIALIGAGRMGGALAAGWIASGISASDIVIIDPHPGAQAQAVIDDGAAHFENASSADVSGVETVVLAVKPQMFDALSADIASALPEDCLVISVMAGTSLRMLSAAFKGHALVRAMPNTPAAIGKGLTGFYAPGGKADAKMAQRLLSPTGVVIQVDKETLIDVVTAVSGSGPAYVFHMVEALQAAAVRAGMDAEIAGLAARQTIIGAGALLDQSADSATELRVAVTSPNGTTQAGLEVLMDDDGLPQLMRKTVMAAFERAKELGS
ncbi:pyrroline-5-carboxylate reductase [Robiginitomaculum antarcticum]|uniref:pyrroline-5-carboxylate reductase n=1 Tax=Robiginitomaculum antarcticum TaxID=437507 RepID=UPI00036AD091|nr:pyrroline-5-carboxylate reductase [Robiginitomaculum antarcticum]